MKDLFKGTDIADMFSGSNQDILDAFMGKTPEELSAIATKYGISLSDIHDFTSDFISKP